MTEGSVWVSLEYKLMAYTNNMVCQIFLSNIPYPLIEMTDAHAMYVDIISTYMFVRRDEVTFKAGMKILCEGNEFLLQDYIDEDGNFRGWCFKLVPTQDEVPLPGLLQAKECIEE